MAWFAAGWAARGGGPCPRYEGQACAFTGGFIPFAKTKADRLAKGDPRLSLEERYPSFTYFYYQARMILNQLVAQRYMRSEDAAAELNAALNGVLTNNLVPKDGLAAAWLARRAKPKTAAEEDWQ